MQGIQIWDLIYSYTIYDWWNHWYSFTKNHYFLKKCNFSSPFQHDATICDKSVCNVKLPQNHGLSDEVCLNSLYRPIHILFEPNVEYLVKKLHFARVFWLFGLPNFIQWPCNAQIWIPHEILHLHNAPRSLQPLKKCLWGMVKKYLQNWNFPCF